MFSRFNAVNKANLSNDHRFKRYQGDIHKQADDVLSVQKQRSAVEQTGCFRRISEVYGVIAGFRDILLI